MSELDYTITNGLQEKLKIRESVTAMSKKFRNCPTKDYLDEFTSSIMKDGNIDRIFIAISKAPKEFDTFPSISQMLNLIDKTWVPSKPHATTQGCSDCAQMGYIFLVKGNQKTIGACNCELGFSFVQSKYHPIKSKADMFRSGWVQCEKGNL